MDTVEIILRTPREGKQFISSESKKYGVDVVFSETDGLIGNPMFYEAMIVITPAAVSAAKCFFKALFAYLSTKTEAENKVEIKYKDFHLKNVKSKDVPLIFAEIKALNEAEEEKKADEA